jgi:acetyltransferase-like isoleucine patch superfamily enzyme
MLNRFDRDHLVYYINSQSDSVGRYLCEQLLMALVGWIPSLLGIGLRSIFYRQILHAKKLPLIESGVRLAHPGNIRLGEGVYLDNRVYLHASPSGIEIGDYSTIMHGSILHVFNFRDLPKAGITIGNHCFIGEGTVIRGQGGVHIGNHVYTGPHVKIVAADHVFEDPQTLIKNQGITARGIVIENDVWLATGVIVTDGVTIGEGSVVGAGAVVTESLPPYSVAVGSPAKRIRDRRHQVQNLRTQAPRYFGRLEKIRKNRAKMKGGD